MPKPKKTPSRSTRTEPATVPRFTSEAEERAFWQDHDSAEYVEWKLAPLAMV